MRKCRVVKINCLKRAVPRHRFLRFGVSTHTVLTFDIFEEVMMGCGPGSGVPVKLRFILEIEREKENSRTHTGDDGNCFRDYRCGDGQARCL